MRRIVIAADGSTTSRVAAFTGLELASSLASAVTFVTVLHEPPPTFDSGATTPSDAVMFLINDAITEARRLGVAADYQILDGDTVQVITQFAKDCDADLIVVGSRGLGALAGALLGSVSNGVLSHADPDVLVVKPGSQRDGPS